MRASRCAGRARRATVRTLTYAELRREVNRPRTRCVRSGWAKGDAIGVFMPMTPECVIAMLAIIKIGGDLPAALLRLRRAGRRSRGLPMRTRKALFIADGFFRRGKLVPMKPVADEAASQVPTLEHIDRPPPHRLPGGVESRARPLVARAGSRAAPMACNRAHERRRPLMIIYTSGTTGQTQGRRAHALRLPDQGRAGHGARPRPASRRNALLGHRHRLDDGAVAGLRHAAARRDDAALRRRAGLSRAGSALGARRAAPRHDARHFADARPRADPPRRRARARARSLVAAEVRLDGRAVESRTRGSGFSTRSAAARGRSSTTPAAPRSPAAS